MHHVAIMEDSYQHTKYHKQTKNQWARDDPAFVVILILFLVFATSAYCAAFGESAAHAALTITSVVFVHFLFAGLILATLCWLYAFDVHCNSFFPAFIILYVLQYFLSPLLIAHGFFPALLSNLLFMVAISYYHYLNFLGYDVLPFLDRTTFFLYPIGLVIILSPLSKCILYSISFIPWQLSHVFLFLSCSDTHRVQSDKILFELVLQLRLVTITLSKRRLRRQN
ncbi:hypothetical protein QYE76_003900 [Lolium multiflorum]|uniref:Uncharacterized protein n=1 Tax=Lolium multiflorum TaxID=4521 RepID=A0AAD8RQ62_LOLMU|nr:hypothetical protein QYE76_003900 [Lolium multiflorum]